MRREAGIGNQKGFEVVYYLELMNKCIDDPTRIRRRHSLLVPQISHAIFRSSPDRQSIHRQPLTRHAVCLYMVSFSLGSLSLHPIEKSKDVEREQKEILFTGYSTSIISHFSLGCQTRSLRDRQLLLKPILTLPHRIDNTPTVYTSILSVLSSQNPSSIAINTHSSIAFSSGLHVGELSELKQKLGSKWTSRFVDRPMVAVEFIGTMVEGRLDWYRKLQETAWAIIGEAFSERVIVPGVTTTEVSFPFSLLLCFDFWVVDCLRCQFLLPCPGCWGESDGIWCG